MSAQQLLLPFRPVINLRGGLEAGAILDVFLSGTSTRATIYSDEALTLPLSNPLTADSFGIFPTIYYDTDNPIRVVVKQSNGTVVADQDPYLGDALPAGVIGFQQNGTGALAETVQEELRKRVSVSSYASESDALAAAGTRPVLFSDGSERLTDTAWAPAQTSGIVGSVRPKDYELIRRTGGYGSYGLKLVEYLISAPSNGTGEFDVGITSWVTHQNLSNNNQVFGMWAGANTPGSALNDFNGNPLPSQTYANGAAIGIEVNVGNRWGDFGLRTDIGTGRWTTGINIVPDVIPASDGVTVDVYPGSFGIVFDKSIHGHKWWTIEFCREDTINPGGIGLHYVGGSVSGNAPVDWVRLNGFWVDGLDFTRATFSGAQINLSFTQTHSGTATAGGVVSPGNFQGFLTVFALDGTVVKVPYFNA